jgi:hypothetical protein
MLLAGAEKLASETVIVREWIRDLKVVDTHR